MRLLAILVALAFVTAPAYAAVIHDEGVDGDLSTDPATPTSIALVPGSNTVIGSCGTGDTRDFMTFTVPPGATLIGLNLVGYSPNDTGYIAINAGTTSFVPSGGNMASFLAGVHINAAQVGSNIMMLFMTSSIIVNSLPAPNVGPGDYCIVIQQTGQVVNQYELEYILETSVPTEEVSWSQVKLAIQ